MTEQRLVERHAFAGRRRTETWEAVVGVDPDRIEVSVSSSLTGVPFKAKTGPILTRWSTRSASDMDGKYPKTALTRPALGTGRLDLMPALGLESVSRVPVRLTAD